MIKTVYSANYTILTSQQTLLKFDLLWAVYFLYKSLQNFNSNFVLGLLYYLKFTYFVELYFRFIDIFFTSFDKFFLLIIFNQENNKKLKTLHTDKIEYKQSKYKHIQNTIQIVKSLYTEKNSMLLKFISQIKLFTILK